MARRAALSRAASDLPWGGGATTAMRKLLGALPLPRARQLRALTRRVVVGPPASEAVRASAGAAPPGLLAVLEVAFANGVGLAFQYTDREGRTTQRRVEPHGLCIEPPVWYILARDVEKDAARAFRMDRIARPRSLPEIRFRPDLAAVTHDLPDRERWRPLSGAWD